MKQIYLVLLTLSLAVITFTSCSKEPEDPYFERAKAASQKAQEQLTRD